MKTVRSNLLFKAISVIVAGIFLWDQMVWAGDFSAQPVSPVLEVLDTPSNGIDAATVQSWQTAKMNLVNTKQAIEDNSSSVPVVCANSEPNNTDGPGYDDTISAEYDEYGRLIKEEYDNGEVRQIEYWNTSDTKKHKEYYFKNGSVWQWSEHYHE
ncbi:MAG: hypothetical protein HQ594_02515, partial [Candidatus Omnitrophica bacterium]|nr:hypothetical protein [Candidatus Omnitrophota bacterium]